MYVSASFYSQPLSGLGSGGAWDNYTAELTSSQPYTLTLEDAVVTVDGTGTYTGSFTLVATGPTTVEGQGHTAMPNFAESAAIQTTDGHLMIGPASGSWWSGASPSMSPTAWPW